MYLLDLIDILQVEVEVVLVNQVVDLVELVEQVAEQLAVQIQVQVLQEQLTLEVAVVAVDKVSQIMLQVLVVVV